MVPIKRWQQLVTLRMTYTVSDHYVDRISQPPPHPSHRRSDGVRLHPVWCRRRSVTVVIIKGFSRAKLINLRATALSMWAELSLSWRDQNVPQRQAREDLQAGKVLFEERQLMSELQHVCFRSRKPLLVTTAIDEYKKKKTQKNKVTQHHRYTNPFCQARYLAFNLKYKYK